MIRNLFDRKYTYTINFLLFFIIVLPYNLRCYEDNSVCLGTTNGPSKLSNLSHYQMLKQQFSLCNRISGNLEITHINGLDEIKEGEEPFDFLKHIEEIRGYLLIYQVENIPKIILPNLRVIWGDTLFDPLHREGRYSIFVGLTDMEKLIFPNLTKIEKGLVEFNHFKKLCYLKDKIDWEQLLGPHYNDRIIFDVGNEYNTCDSDNEVLECHPSCNGNCWGNLENECQIVFKNFCPISCHNHGCYKDHHGHYKCCDSMCTGGCFGHGRSKCAACANYIQDGECVQSCRGLNYYNKITGRLEDAKDPRYTFKRYCVSECPSETLIEKDYCVTRCKPKYFYNITLGDRTCRECGTYCDKICEINEPLTKRNIEKLKNCEYVDGFIDISSENFNKFNEESLNKNDLEYLKNIKLITDYVIIKTGKSPIVNLNFLSNLETIIGRKFYMERVSLAIVHNHNLRELQLKNLKTIKRGHVVVANNDKLCLADTINWNITFPDTINKVTRNGKKSWCENNQINRCDDECDTSGCWGYGNKYCLSCKNVEYDGECYNECPPDTFRKNISTKECIKCHPECIGCTGETQYNCIECVSLLVLENEDKNYCAKTCPKTHYLSGNNCIPCHESCYEFGCTGQSDILGDGGCNGCKYAKEDINEFKEHLYTCLYYDGNPENVCKDVGLTNYFTSTHKPKNGMKVEYLVCQKCDDECESCSGIGRSVQMHDCKCKNKILIKNMNDSNVDEEEICVNECPINSFSMIEHGKPNICQSCHRLCDAHKSCYGPEFFQCENCEYAGFKKDDGTIICTEECNEEFPYINEYDRLCYAEDIIALSKYRRTKFIIIIGTILVIILMTLIIAIWYCINYRRKYRKEVELNMPSIPDYDLSKTQANMGRINLITMDQLEQTTQIIGQGAFGVVYAGKWKNPIKDCKNVPVAIKVMKAKTSIDSKEILEEAGMMAQVSGGHKHLHPIIGICFCNTVQIVTLLRPLGSLLHFLKKHKDKLGASKILLYCFQISSAMEYLAQRGMVHRDLAARNVLVKNINHVEVTDFGLAKMLHGEECIKLSGKVAVKWLAIETLTQTIFNHATDVWAFAVTCWEILTFGQAPYQGISLSDIKDHLLSGNRLEQPNNCSQELYHTLLHCWMPNPEARPSFTLLKETFQNYCKAPHQYVTEYHLHNKMEMISNFEQFKMIADLLNDEDFMDPLDYQDFSQQSQSNLPSGNFFNDSPNSPTRPLLPRYDAPCDSMTSSSLKYKEPLIGNKHNKFEMIPDEGTENYLVPKEMDEDAASVYTDVVTMNEYMPEYYNDISKVQKSASGGKVNDYVNQNAIEMKVLTKQDKIDESDNDTGIDKDIEIINPVTENEKFPSETSV
uniref:receptor protein-tyrosine kinase n=1 Tax=Strongyloides stercoralis TaxID=6248 RepID=A0A913IFD1_STRER